jgi:hypothetical protein
MATRSPKYSNLSFLRLSVTTQQDRFLKAKAAELGLGKSEFLRRLLHDAMTVWAAAGLYEPATPPPPRRERPLSQPKAQNGAWSGE